jgi:hypothetical protein
MEEFSLAWKDDNSGTFINVPWLNPQMPLVSQGVGGSRVLLLRKKYFVKNKDLEDCLNSNKTSVMLETIYAQLRQSFVAGLYGCSAFQAAQIAGMAALVEYPSSMVRNPLALRKIGLIKKVLPEKFWSVKGIENQIAKGIENVHLTELEAMKAFVSRLRKLETFGASFFTINLSSTEKGAGSSGLLGIGPQYVYKMEVETLDPLEQWYTEDIVSFSAEGDLVHLQFGEETINFMAEDGESIISFLGGYKKQLNTEEAKVVIQRSRSRRLSRADLELPSVEGIPQESPTVEISEHSSNHVQKEEKTEPPSPLRTAAKQSPEKKINSVSRHPPVVRRQLQDPDKISKEKPDENKEDSPPVPPRKSSLVPRSPKVEDRPCVLPTKSCEGSSSARQQSPKIVQSPPPIPQHSPKIAKRSSLIEQLDSIIPISTVSSLPEAKPPTPPNRDSSLREQTTPSATVAGSSEIHGSVLKPQDPVSASLEKPKDLPHPPEIEQPVGEVEQPVDKVKQHVDKPERPIVEAVEPELSAGSPSLKIASSSEITNSPVFNVKRSEQHMISSSEENLDIVEEEDEEKLSPSIPGSPVSLSSPDSFRSEEDKRVENEKKFDTLTRQSSNTALYGRKERLKALKRRKNEGVLTASDMAELKAVSDVKRRASRKAKEVAKYISMPPQSNSECSSLDDLTDIFELDLTRQRWSQDINPIYDYTAASEAESLLNSSDVTYEDPTKSMFTRGQSAPPNNHSVRESSSVSSKKSLEFPVINMVPMADVKQAQAQVDSIYSRAFSPAVRSGSSASNGSKESGNGDLDTGVYGLVGVNKPSRAEDEVYQVPSTQLDDNVEEDIYRCMDNADRKKLLSDSDREKSPSPTVLVPPHQSNRNAQPSPGIGKRRLVKGKSNMSIKAESKMSLAQVNKAPVEPLKDYGTLKREFRVFYIKLPTGDLVHELVNLNETIYKVITRLCALIGSQEPHYYSLMVEGSVLTSLKEPQTVTDVNETGPKGKPMMDPLGIRSAAFAYLTDQGEMPIELNRERNLRDQGIHTSRILALRFTSDKISPECLPHQPLRVPPHIRFHQCWLSIAHGVQPCSQEDAIRLAALQYQTYFLDRSEHHSTTAHCTASEFLPVEYSTVRNIEEKVMKEQQMLKGYSRRQAQDSYIYDFCELPTYKAVFFPVKEPRKRFFQNTKLMPMLLGVCKTGVMRVDPKSKEVLDFWEYRIVKNWAYTTNTFLLAFDKQNYPVQTNQGKWINSLVEFFVSAIVRKDKSPTPEMVKEGSPYSKKRRSLTVKVPSQEEVNNVYGQVSENGQVNGKEDAPLCTPV